jgi:hypothetical protein
MKRIKHRPSPAMVVALLALLVALGGVGVAATGGNFILGQSNGATSKSSLTAKINDRALAITNLNTGASATALGLNVAAGRPPLIVNSSTRVANLNADKLDGADASSFLAAGGTAANSNLLGGQPSSYYLPVQGSVRQWTYAIAQLDLAGYSDGSKTATCPIGDYALGGGWSVATGDDPDFTIRQSAPTGPPIDGWNVIGRNTGNSHTITVFVWAICARVS